MKVVSSPLSWAISPSRLASSRTSAHPVPWTGSPSSLAFQLEVGGGGGEASVYRCRERAKGHLAGAVCIDAKEGRAAQVEMLLWPCRGLDGPPSAGNVAVAVITPSPTAGAAGAAGAAE